MKFFNKNLFEGPKPFSGDKDEESLSQIKKIRSIRREYGYAHLASILNEKIEKGETIGEYTADKETVELEKLKSELDKLSENSGVQKFFNLLDTISEFDDQVKELEEYLQRVLTDSDSEETDYKEKALELSATKKDVEYASKKLEETDKETMILVNRYIVLENLIKNIIEKPIDERMVDEHGQFLN